MIAILLAILFNDQIFRVLVRLWVLPSDPIPQKVEVIVPLTYGSYKDKLLWAQYEFGYEANRIWDAHKEAIIISGAWSHSPNPEFEKNERKRIMGDRPVVHYGEALNTIDEAEKIRDFCLQRYGRVPSTIVLVTGQMHGRAVKLVWQKTFQQSQIAIRYVPWQYEIETNNVMLLARDKRSWLASQIGRQALISWVPFDLGYNFYKWARIRQPTGN